MFKWYQRPVITYVMSEFTGCLCDVNVQWMLTWCQCLVNAHVMSVFIDCSRDVSVHWLFTWCQWSSIVHVMSLFTVHYCPCVCWQRYSQELASQAQAHADSCVMQHSGLASENMFFSSGLFCHPLPPHICCLCCWWWCHFVWICVFGLSGGGGIGAGEVDENGSSVVCGLSGSGGVGNSN